MRCARARRLRNSTMRCRPRSINSRTPGCQAIEQLLDGFGRAPRAGFCLRADADSRAAQDLMALDSDSPPRLPHQAKTRPTRCHALCNQRCDGAGRLEDSVRSCTSNSRMNGAPCRGDILAEFYDTEYDDEGGSHRMLRTIRLGPTARDADDRDGGRWWSRGRRFPEKCRPHSGIAQQRNQSPGRNAWTYWVGRAGGPPSAAGWPNCKKLVGGPEKSLRA